MKINKVNVAFKYQKDIEQLQQYNNTIKMYNQLIKQLIDKLSELPVVILEDKFEYTVINNIKQILTSERSECSCMLFNKVIGFRESFHTMTIQQLIQEIIVFKQTKLIEDKEEIKNILRFLKS